MFFLQALLNGILVGGFYGFMILGFSIIWGVMGIINLAHGEYVMMGAYFAWVMFRQFGIDPLVSAVLVFPIMFVVGYVLQWLVINRVVERPHLISLLLSFGLSISIANIYKLIYTADYRSVTVAYAGSFEVAGLTFPTVKTIIFFAGLLIMAGLHLFLQRTRLGKSIRAAAQNKEAAKIVGIDIHRVYAITAGICVGLTAMAGAMIAPIQPIFPFMGPLFTVRAFAITALGGLGRIPGALLGGLLLGIVETLLTIYVPGTGAKVGTAVSFLILVLVLVTRPQGLLKGLRPVEEGA
ncbi:MAG: branched-chain amino acid ABC transporter permease [Ardenticatenia bacterium]|nr:branched-chain amino acid ABC transporter permease [Ardenticatenia bacterium]